MVPPVRPATMEDFMRHKLAKFTGKATPNEADAWVCECEKIFEVVSRLSQAGQECGAIGDGTQQS